MQITFLIGNGFDLNLGLKTNYSDFLIEYSRIKESDTEIIKKFKSDILQNQKLWSSAEYAFGQYTKHFKTEGYTAADFLECYIDFCSSLGEYLLSQEQSINLTALQDTLTKDFASSISNFLVGHKTAQQQAIKQSYSSIAGGFNYRFLSFNYTMTLDFMVEQIIANPSILGKRTVGNSLNANDIKPVLHVHGDTEHDMVLGVNDVQQIADASLFEGYGEEYINQLIKIEANRMNEADTDQRALNILKNSNLIYVYGMSFGDTDALWWQRICEIMKEHPTVHLLLHCYDVPTDERIAFTYQSYVSQKKQEFLRHCQYNESVKSQIAQRIHISRDNLFKSLKDIANKSPALSK